MLTVWTYIQNIQFYVLVHRNFYDYVAISDNHVAYRVTSAVIQSQILGQREKTIATLRLPLREG
jgi:hypothetical protein